MRVILSECSHGRIWKTFAQARRGYTIFILGLALFAAWTVAAMTSAVGRADWAIAFSLQRFASSSLDTLSSLITIAGNAEVTVALVLLIGIVFARTRRTRVAVVLWALFIGGSLIELIGKHWLPHPGVPVWLHRPPLNLWHHIFRTSYAYPSGHAFRTLLLAAATWKAWSPEGRSRRLMRYGLVTVVLLMGLALAYLGDHWASEVVGGYLLALMSVGLLADGASDE